MAQWLTGVSRSLSRRMPPRRTDRRGKPARRGRRTGSPTPIQQARHRNAVSAVPNRSARDSPAGVKVRYGKPRVSRTAMVSAMDLYWSGQMTFCRRKVRLRVICPAEGRFSGENRLSAQIRPEPGFGGQIHANREFVRQTRCFPYRHGLRDGLVRQGRVCRTERSR